jgi:anti-sigma B factor antagonist
MQFSLQVQGRVGGGTVIAARGDLEFSTVRQFRGCIEQALQPPPGILYLDLRLVTFLDSSGLGVLVQAQKLAERAGTRLVVESPSEPVLRTLRTAGLLDFLGLPPA